MTRDDIKRMAREAGMFWFDYGSDDGDANMLERFAALVAAAEREKVAAWMRARSYATGHGDTTEDLLEEIQAQVAERERWECAEVAEAYEPRCDTCPSGVANAIRARGNT